MASGENGRDNVQLHTFGRQGKRSLLTVPQEDLALSLVRVGACVGVRLAKLEGCLSIDKRSALQGAEVVEGVGLERENVVPRSRWHAIFVREVSASMHTIASGRDIPSCEGRGGWVVAIA